jgi:hypothetical protein
MRVAGVVKYVHNWHAQLKYVSKCPNLACL